MNKIGIRNIKNIAKDILFLIREKYPTIVVMLTLTITSQMEILNNGVLSLFDNFLQLKSVYILLGVTIVTLIIGGFIHQKSTHRVTKEFSSHFVELLVCIIILGFVILFEREIEFINKSIINLTLSSLLIAIYLLFVFILVNIPKTQ